MANEATLIFELEPAIPFTVADGTAIEKGALLANTDPMTAIAVSSEAEALAGIAASEKIADDGKVKLGVYRKGIFKMTASGAIVIGNPVVAANANYVQGIALSPVTASGARVLGMALETAADTETFLVDVNIGAGGIAASK